MDSTPDPKCLLKIYDKYGFDDLENVSNVPVQRIEIAVLSLRLANETGSVEYFVSAASNFEKARNTFGKRSREWRCLEVWRFNMEEQAEFIKKSITPVTRKDWSREIYALDKERYEIKSWLREVTTVEKAEQEHLVKDDKLGAEPIPFGYVNDHWLRLKSKIKEGDELWTFTSTPWTWQLLCGREGLCIVRDGEVGDFFLTRMS